MKFVLLILLVGAAHSSILEPHNLDFISMKNHTIIYADGTAKEILDLRQPILRSWRRQRCDLVNMCKSFTCDYAFIKQSQFPNRFVSHQCYLTQDIDCLEEEFTALTTLEQIFHESDFATTIELGGETFGLIGNSKTEDAMVLELNVKVVEQENKLVPV